MQVEGENVWLEARKAFLAFRGVVGVGYGPKERGGKVEVWQAIVVLVEQKLPRNEVPPGELIPESFRGVPTDVRVPRLTPNAASGRGELCLTDYQWIDWDTIHRRHMEERR
jgi:hypothetical protein